MSNSHILSRPRNVDYAKNQARTPKSSAFCAVERQVASPAGDPRQDRGSRILLSFALGLSREANLSTA